MHHVDFANLLLSDQKHFGQNGDQIVRKSKVSWWWLNVCTIVVVCYIRQVIMGKLCSGDWHDTMFQQNGYTNRIDDNEGE